MSDAVEWDPFPMTPDRLAAFKELIAALTDDDPASSESPKEPR